MDNADLCSQLWHQLHFSQPSVRTASIEQSRTLIEVTLTYANETTPRSSNSLHKIDLDVPFFDVKPPPGVLTAVLETVELDIKLYAGDRLSAEPSTGGHDIASAPHWHECFDDDADDSGSEMLLEPENYNEGRSLPRLLDSPSTLSEPTLQASISELPETMPRTYQVLNLLDAAIRRAISGSLERLSCGIVMKCNRSFKTLSSIAPSLFRPGHLPAVASRSVFLPTIGRSLAAISSKCSATNALKMTKPSQPHCDAGQDVSTEQVVLRDESVSSSEHWSKILWSTIERGLLDSMPETRLKPLATGVTDSQGVIFDDELLEVNEMDHLFPQLLLSKRVNDEISEVESHENFYSDSDDLFNDPNEYSEHEDEDEIYNGDEFSSVSVEDSYWDHENLFDEVAPENDFNLQHDAIWPSVSVGESGWNHQDLRDQITQRADIDHLHDGVWSRPFNNNTGLSDIIGVGGCMFEEDTRSMCESMGAMSMLDDDADAISSSVCGMDDQEMLLT